MKKTLLTIIICTISFISLMLCHSSGEELKVSKVTVRLNKTKAIVGGNVQVAASCYDSSGKIIEHGVEWYSKAGPIVQGILKAKRAGKLKVIARVGKIEGNADLDIAMNPKAPAKQKKFLFIHHSCGSNLLKDGLREELKKNNYLVNDASYGTEIAQNTNPSDFPTTFGSLFEKVMTFKLPEGERHDIVAFKSCYPACNINSDKMLEDNKSYYNTIMKRFKENPNTMFIAFSPPPLVPAATNQKNAARARAFANWLQDEYSFVSWNVVSFNFYGILANSENVTDEKYRKSDKDSHPNSEGNKEAIKQFIPFINNAVNGM